MTYPALPDLPGAKLLKSLDDEQATEIFSTSGVVVCRRKDRDGSTYGEPGPDPSRTAERIRSSLVRGSHFGYTVDQLTGPDSWLNGRTTTAPLPHPYGVVLRFDELVERFAALAKRARRLGVEEPSFDVLAERLLPGRFGGVVAATLIKVAATPPVKFDGWTFVATVEHDKETGINVVRKAPSAEGLPLPVDTWRVSNTCDHCGTARKRNETFVVRHDDGRLVRVGRSCLKDFTGHADPARLVLLVELELLLRATRDIDEGFDGPPTPVPSTELFLAFVARSIRLDGWVSRGAARETSYTATADLAERGLWKAFLARQKGDRVPAEDFPSADDDERAEAALAWVRGWDFDAIDSDYRRNLYAACIKGCFSGKSSGLVASAVSSHALELELEVKRRSQGASLANSEFLGRVGDKIGRKLSRKDKDNGAEAHPTWTATVTGLREFFNDWGCSTLVSFRDEAGNAAAWWSSQTPRYTELSPDGLREAVAVGDVVEVVGTIKKVETYSPPREGATAYKQTTLIRVALTAA